MNSSLLAGPAKTLKSHLHVAELKLFYFASSMEVAEKKNKNKPYKPILDGIPDWPVYQLSKNRKEFIEEVAQKAFNEIKKNRPMTKQLIDELEATVYREQQRMKRNRWRVDPADEPRFWGNMKEELVALSAKEARGMSGQGR